MSKLRWVVPALAVLVWLAVGAIGGPYAGQLGEVAENDGTAFLPESAESTRVSELERGFSDTDAVPAIVVAEHTSGLTAADRAYVERIRAQAGDLDGVSSTADPGGGVQPPIPSRDGQALQLVVPLTGTVDGTVEELRRLLGRDRPTGLRVFVTGPAGQVADLGAAFGGLDGLLLLVAGTAVAIILVAVYRSPLLPLLVLLSAVFALSLASVVVYVLTDAGVLTLNGQSQGILFILVVGAATDYALLLVARFREELRITADRYRAIRTAWRATIEPIAASAVTVILGVLCLLLSDLSSNRGLGPVAAIGIAAAFLAATTFLPAVLALFGRSAFWPFRPTISSPVSEHLGVWGKVARGVGRRPRTVWVVTALVLLGAATFVPQLKANGTAQTDVFLTEVDSVTGQDVLSEHFPGGLGTPTIILTDADSVQAVVQTVGEVSGVAQVQLTTVDRTRTGPAGTGDADSEPVVVNGRARVLVTLAYPADSTAATDTVQRIRDTVDELPSADALVGGQTATLLDTQQTSERDRTVIIPVVLAVVLAVLVLLLRSLLAPVLLLATVVLSFGATIGVSALMFNHVFGFPGADPVVPLFGFVFLVALGIDYNIFLMTRVRDETSVWGTRDGTLRGLTVTGGVITSAGVVLAATFSALAVLPILFLAQIAFIVAFGVLLDTLVVRTLLVPALTIDIGERTWWPSKLAPPSTVGDVERSETSGSAGDIATT